MKKFLFIVLFSGMLLSSCSFENEKKQTVLSLINDLSLNNHYFCNVENLQTQEKETFIVDNLSFIKEDIVYYKYLYKDNYQVYQQDEVKSDQVIDTRELNGLNGLINRVLYNSNNFSIVNDVYTLYEKSYNLFDLNFLEQNLESFTLQREDNFLVFNLEFSDNNYLVKYSYTDKNIYPYATDEENYHSFFKNNHLSFEEMKKKSQQEDFVIIVESDSCTACAYAEKYYYLFQYENNYQTFYSLKENEISHEQKKEFIKDIANVYENQKEEFKHPYYEKYPQDNFLTPTAVRFVNGNIKSVYLGISKNDVNAFHNFCYEK